MIWSIETDDFRGKCGNGKFPLLSAIRKGLNGQIVENPPESSISTSTTTTQTSTLSTSSTTPSSTSISTTQSSSQQTTPSTISSSPSSSTTVDPSASTTSTTTASSSATTPSNPDKFKCKEEGFFRDEKDCVIFYRCVYVGEFGEDGLKYRLFTYNCPHGTVFDPATYLCVWPSAVKGCENYYEKNHI